MKTLKYLALLCGALTMAGCASNRGGTADPYNTESGGSNMGATTGPSYVSPQEINAYPPTINGIPSLPPP